MLLCADFISLLFGCSMTAVDRSDDRQMEKEKRRLEQAKQAKPINDNNEMHYVRLLHSPSFPTYLFEKTNSQKCASGLLLLR